MAHKEKIEIKVANDDTRIDKVDQVLPPIAFLEKFPASEAAAALVQETRHKAHDIIHAKDDRLLVIIGPGSIHDPKAAIEYAKRLKVVRDKYKDSLDQYVKVLYPIVIAAIIAGLIFAQPDLGTTIIFVLIVASIFFMAPISKEIRNKILIIVMGAIVIATLVLVCGGSSLLTEGQKQRFDFSNPCSTEKFYSTGNQVCNGYIAINNGKFFGVGLGNSTQKYVYLPEAHTDFIFAIIMEELGYAGAIVILFLYYLLIGRIIKIARDSYNTRGFLICMGVAVYIVVHIFVNLGGIFGIMPMTGVPLPFMSYGGSFAMCLVFALTLVQRINVENKMYSEKKDKKIKKVKQIVKKQK